MNSCGYVDKHLWQHFPAMDRDRSCHWRLWFTKIHSCPWYLLSVNVCNALPTVHALTGCDTTSAIFWLGKKYVCNVITKNADICIDPDSAHWGNDIDEAVTAAWKLTVALYDSTLKHKVAHQSLNDMRLKMIKAKDTNFSRIPRCENSFLQHVKRCIYQVNIWAYASLPIYECGKPADYGWVW